ncbi:DUF2850 domain-containing protein [Vibrio sp. SCSIO 43140]|uniref:DUF2850 domain-containing protein n=1 Tax=Vibrio sp. SCSIO 43140 TaxID=2819100 RepID=UPI0020763DB8|nr:DUF2850 domain-containing protein [Vibrio sp. SCSIO 43140]USD59759.1 DUF2850 domain-containing protein [Vibrio sp. SCSIO 43140]
MSDGKESSIVSGVNVNVAQKSAVKPNKWLERTLILLALVGTFAVVGLYQDLFGRVHQQINPKAAVYGLWQEKDVAPFARESFELGENRVVINNRVVATSFEISSSELWFNVGVTEYRYQFLDRNKTEIRQLSPAHYKPTFVLSGKHKKDLR